MSSPDIKRSSKLLTFSWWAYFHFVTYLLKMAALRVASSWFFDQGLSTLFKRAAVSTAENYGTPSKKMVVQGLKRRSEEAGVAVFKEIASYPRGQITEDLVRFYQDGCKDKHESNPGRKIKKSDMQILLKR